METQTLNTPGYVSKLREVILNMYCEFSNKRYQAFARFQVLTAALLNIKSDVMTCCWASHSHCHHQASIKNFLACMATKIKAL